MDSKFDNKNKFINIKITFIEIFPAINEIIKPKEDLNIVFQGNDNFYDFKKYLSSKNPIILNYNKKSIIMTLLKNNNIYATGFFTIRQGEQNIFFNYENNKENISNKAVNINNVSKCIKIKLFCEFDHLSTISTININRNTININYDNGNNYVNKVNVKKPIRINNFKNKINNKKINDKKKKLLNNIHQTNNNSIQKKLVNYSQEFPEDYNAILTEEKNFNNNLINNDVKKFSKIINNTARKNENSKSKVLNNRIYKTKSKNFFSTNKKQNKNIKMNNSSLNLINQNNKINSNDICQDNHHINNNPNYYTNRSKIKTNTSFNKTIKRNSNNSNNLSNKQIKTSLNNYISGQIIEHVNSKEKLNYISINKATNKNIYTNNKKESKKTKSNNITMNSISTSVTKKNELEFSLNSLQDCDDKKDLNYNLSNKNNLRPNSNRTNKEKTTQKLSGNKNDYNNNAYDIIERNYPRHKFNKSLCQQSFTEKIFCENNDLNFYHCEKKENSDQKLCKSENKLVVNMNDINNNINNFNAKENENNINNNNENSNNNNLNDDEEINEIDLENNNYSKLKEDFNLLYNLDYISKISEDLLKLEAELFIEKMSELFSEYHYQIDEKILERNIINREYKINLRKYSIYDKLNDKLNFIKKKDVKEKRIDINENISKQNNKNIEANINELDIIKNIFPDLINDNIEDKKNKLKNILTIILKKEGTNELIKEKLDKLENFL